MTVDWAGLLTDGPAEAPASRWCVTCETKWRTAVPCPICGNPGVLAEHPPEGWPAVHRTADPVEPRSTR